MKDIEILKSAGLYLKDPSTGKQGITFYCEASQR